jgi:hypothetical protein
MPGRASPWELQIAPTGQRIPGRASPWELQIAPTGQRIPAQGANPGNRIPENRCVLKEHRIRKAGVDIRGPRLCGVPSERRFVFPGGFPGLHPGLVCGAPSAPLTDGVGSVLDREVDALPDEGMGSELWWWIGSNGATHTNPDGNALRLPQRGDAYLAQGKGRPWDRVFSPTANGQTTVGE